MSANEQTSTRRRELETEQLALWCQIAFHNIVHQRLPERPLYRFELTPHVDSEQAKHDESMRMVVQLMDQAFQVIADVERSRGKPLRKIAPPISKARLELTDTWRKQGEVFEDATKKKRELRYSRDKLVRLAELLEDHGKIVDDSYPRALKHAQSPADSNLNNPQQTWNQVSDSLIAMAAVMLVLDDTALLLAGEWDAKPNLEKPLVIENDVPQRDVPSIVPDPVPTPSSTFDLSQLREVKIQHQKKKKKTWASHPVTHQDGVAYIDRASGKKVVLTLQGNTLSWPSPQGGQVVVYVDKKRTDTGHPVRLITGP